MENTSDPSAEEAGTGASFLVVRSQQSAHQREKGDKDVIRRLARLPNPECGRRHRVEIKF